MSTLPRDLMVALDATSRQCADTRVHAINAGLDIDTADRIIGAALLSDAIRARSTHWASIRARLTREAAL